MGIKIGIDVGGTFTDFLVAWEEQAPEIFKVLSTPSDPSVGVLEGLSRIAAAQQPGVSIREFIDRVDTIVHGTTVTTNATLTRNGAKSALLTTAGMRDALEMRRGVREEQYNNRYTNVTPLVPRYLRAGVGGRMDRNGGELHVLHHEDVQRALELFKQEGVEAISICFMNAFANPAHEEQAAAAVRAAMPDVYLTVSTALLPSIRFYDRLSTTALNSYVGPILSRYLDQLTERLRDIGFRGTLLIMQSNGGVMAPEVARDKAALTLLSGPAAGPGAGQVYARAHKKDDCIVIDMGGTSFEASLVAGTPIMVNDGSIDRHRIALPMLGIHTIGAGGGSIGWIDEGGLLRMGPQSAGADPGPACYGRGGTLPACTDANLVLGYLDADFFAGGAMPLDTDRARRAIEQHIATRLGMTIEEAAAGMYRVVCNNMAQGIREVSIKRGFDPREFPLIVAGGAGPIHSCLICEELEIPFQIIPRESSILCAVGMLMGDLVHDFVRTFVSRFDCLDWPALERILGGMTDQGRDVLQRELIPAQRQAFQVKFDCRYLKQFHEVSFSVPAAAIDSRNTAAVAQAFHAEHNRLYGYSLEEQQVPVEIINVRLQAIGHTDKPTLSEQPRAGRDPAPAFKGERPVYLPGAREFHRVPIYDGHRLRHGNQVPGPAVIEEATTAIFVGESFDCVIDALGSSALYRKGRPDLVAGLLEGRQP